MFKNVVSWLLAFILLISVSAAGFAVIKGLDRNEQSLVKVGESITIPEGAQVKTAVSVGGSVIVYGEVAEDVVAVGGTVYLKDSALVGGDVVSVGGKVMKESGAITKGDIVEVSIPAVTPAIYYFTKGGMLTGLILFSLLSFIGFVILVVILVAFFTPQLGKVSAEAEKRIWYNSLVGLLISILFIPIIIVLAISLVGIIFIPVWVALIVAAAVFGFLAVSHVVGKKILYTLKISGKTMMFETLTGFILLALVGIVPIVGHLVKAIVVLCGLGAVYHTRFGTK